MVAPSRVSFWQVPRGGRGDGPGWWGGRRNLQLSPPVISAAPAHPCSLSALAELCPAALSLCTSCPLRYRGQPLCWSLHVKPATGHAVRCERTEQLWRARQGEAMLDLVILSLHFFLCFLISLAIWRRREVQAAALGACTPEWAPLPSQHLLTPFSALFL